MERAGIKELLLPGKLPEPCQHRAFYERGGHRHGDSAVLVLVLCLRRALLVSQPRLADCRLLTNTWVTAGTNMFQNFTVNGPHTEAARAEFNQIYS